MPRHHKKYESSSSSSSYSSSSCSSYSSRSSKSSVDSELKELECKLTKKMERLYCKFLWNLRREPCLMLGGSDAHASVYAYTANSTVPGGNVVFDQAQFLTNVDYTNGNDFIVVRRTGLYYFSWNAQFNEPCQIGLFVNGVLDATTVMSNNSGATVTSASQMLRLISGDRIELRNLGNNIITSTLAAAGNPLLQSQNVDFTIFKIAPNSNVCGPFPIPFEKGRCCDNVEKWNAADKNLDSQISKCEEKIYNIENKCDKPHTPPPPPPVPQPPCEQEHECRRKHRRHRHHRH
jgi:hypothetical protein